jgi:hypothetical protein
MQVHELVTRCAAAVETTDPMGAARKMLEDLRGEIDHIEKMMAYISGVWRQCTPGVLPLAQPDDAQGLLSQWPAYAAT